MSNDVVDVPGLLRALDMEFRTRGNELWACCPSHNEDTASWSIRNDPGNPRHGGHRCFGCGFEGGPFALVMEVIGFGGYSAARKWMVERGLLLGASVPPALELQARASRRIGMVQPRGVRVGPLDTWPTPGARYARSRGLTNAQLERWGIGCGVAGRLSCRLYLPTHDVLGRLVNYTARAYARQEPKYLDPGIDEGANRSSVFGQQYWPVDRGARAHAELVLCEGELNALAFERAGVRYVGALGGSELDPGQVLQLNAFGSVLVAVDFDTAGSKVASALHALLSRHTNARRVHFPDDMDACDVEADGGSLQQLMREAS